MVKLGTNLYAGMLTERNLQFIRQVGATHLVAHLPGPDDLPGGDGYWRYEDLRALRRRVNDAGVELEAIENFPVAHWDQILLDRPGRARQLENIKRTIANMGRAGIPVMGYYFSLAGVWGRVERPFARGGAISVGYLAEDGPPNTPLTEEEVWGQPAGAAGQPVGPVSRDAMWERLASFLEGVLPVAEEAGVRLAAHPDDPPVPVLRGCGRLITEGTHFERLLGLDASPSNAIEFCQGTVSEMADTDVYETIRTLAPTGRVAYVHFRNVRGKVPHYEEVFVDEGDVDMLAALRAWSEGGFDGVMIPDHTPQTACDAPWHAGVAFALGYMKGLMRLV